MSEAKPLVHVELDRVDRDGGVYLKVTTHNNPVPQHIKLDREYPSLTITEKRRKLFDRY